MKRLIWHWTAGTNKASATDKRHYHGIIEGDGRFVAGDRLPEANLDTSDGDYAAHTRGTNTGAIGLALAAMAGAKERPFSPGKYPITQKQLEALVAETADLCETYGIPVTRRTVLSHAEVQPTLGVKQRGKWDIMWLPGMTAPDDPVVVGDRLRAMVKLKMAKPVAKPNPIAAFFAAILKAFGKGKS
jgi:hypothetical protein